MASLVINHGAARAATQEHPHEHGPAPVGTAPSPERVAMPPVTVNGVAIPRKAIAAEVQNFPARNPGEGWRAATRALVIRELLLQEARRLEIPVEQKTDADGRRETEEDAVLRAGDDEGAVAGAQPVQQADDHAEAGGVEEHGRGQVEDQVEVPVVDQADAGGAQLRGGADLHPAAHLDDGDLTGVVHDADAILNGLKLSQLQHRKAKESA